MMDDSQNQAVNAATAQNQLGEKTDSVKGDNAGYFQEDNGTYSSMRLMCFVSLIAAITFGLLSIWLNANGKVDNGNGIYITFGFLVGAFAPKEVQKFAEQKINAKGA